MSDARITTYSIEPDWRQVLRFMDHALSTGSVIRSKRAEFKAERDNVAAYVAHLDAQVSK